MKSKKVISLLLTTALTAGLLAGCGGSGDSGSGSSGADSKSAEESSAEEASGEAPEGSSEAAAPRERPSIPETRTAIQTWAARPSASGSP